MRFKFFIWAFFIFFVLCACNTRNSVKMDSFLDKKEIIIGTQMNLYPYCWRYNNSIIGIDDELGRLLGRSAKCNVILHPLPQSDLIPALLNGTVDIVMSGIPVTEQNKQKVDFCNPLTYFGLVKLARSTEVATLKNMDLQTVPALNIAVVKNSEAEQWVLQNCPLAEIITCDDFAATVRCLEKNQVDLVIGHGQEALSACNRRLSVIFPPLTKEPIAWAIKKENTELKNYLNIFLKNASEQGFLEEPLAVAIPPLNQPLSTPIKKP